MSEGVKVENMDKDDITSSDITTGVAATTTTTTMMTEAIHDVMNNDLEEERKMNEEANEEEVEVIRITMSIPELSSLPLESANTTSTPEGNFFFVLHHENCRKKCGKILNFKFSFPPLNFSLIPCNKKHGPSETFNYVWKRVCGMTFKNSTNAAMCRQKRNFHCFQYLIHASSINCL